MVRLAQLRDAPLPSSVGKKMPSVVVAVVVALFAVVLSSAVVGSFSTEYNGTLRLVNVVFRHGERTPADTYPNDPHLNFDFHPYGWGQLTNEGKMQQFLQGRFLRDRYHEFLLDSFSTESVKVQSTDVDRTIMSAQLTLAGLFPPKGSEIWNKDLDWQPVPVHYQPLNQDSLLLVRVPCPRYYEELERVKSTGEVKQYLSSLTDLYSALTNYSGMPIENPDDVQSLYNTLLGETLFNLSLPEWTKHFFPEEMEAVTAYSFVLNAYNDELKKLKGGVLLKKVIEEIEEKSKDGQSRRKMFLYAGHDATVANLMMALKVWDEQIPVYNIMTLIEMHQINNVYGVKVFLRNSTHHEPYLLSIPGCKEFCPLDKMLELTKSVIPDNLEEECLSHDTEFVPPTLNGP